MFAAPPDLKTEVFTHLPDSLRVVDKHSEWTRARGGPPLRSFLEGPSFDRSGRLYCVDVAHGRIFRVAPDGASSVLRAALKRRSARGSAR